MIHFTHEIELPKAREDGFYGLGIYKSSYQNPRDSQKIYFGKIVGLPAGQSHKIYNLKELLELHLPTYEAICIFRFALESLYGGGGPSYTYHIINGNIANMEAEKYFQKHPLNAYVKGSPKTTKKGLIDYITFYKKPNIPLWAMPLDIGRTDNDITPLIIKHRNNKQLIENYQEGNINYQLIYRNDLNCPLSLSFLNRFHYYDTFHIFGTIEEITNFKSTEVQLIDGTTKQLNQEITTSYKVHTHPMTATDLEIFKHLIQSPLIKNVYNGNQTFYITNPKIKHNINAIFEDAPTATFELHLTNNDTYQSTFTKQRIFDNSFNATFE